MREVALAASRVAEDKQLRLAVRAGTTCKVVPLKAVASLQHLKGPPSSPNSNLLPSIQFPFKITKLN